MRLTQRLPDFTGVTQCASLLSNINPVYFYGLIIVSSTNCNIPPSKSIPNVDE